MRLTVHLAEAPKVTSEKMTKDGPKNYTQVFNTLSFSEVEPDEVNTILAGITPEQGIPMKHYLSGEKITGTAKCKKKK